MQIQEILEKVAEFQKATDQPVADSPSVGDDKNNMLRYQLMNEENREYLTASLQYDKVEILDAVVDMLYILAGTINQHGMQGVIEEAFNRVHANNMTKVGADGKVLRNPDGKILKPENFVPVDLSDLVI